MSRIEQNYERIITYLKGLLSNRLRHDLEKEMMRDVFDEEAFEGLNHLSAGELETDMAVLNNRLEDRMAPVKRRNLTILFRIAAAIILMVGISSILYFLLRTPAPKLVTEKTSQEKQAIPSAPISAQVSDSNQSPVQKAEEIKSVSQKLPPLLAENRQVLKEKISELRSKAVEDVRIMNESPVPAETTQKEENIKIRGIADTAITMQEDLLALDEVVVVGYATRKKSDVTGAVSRVEAKDLSPAGGIEPYNYIKPVPPDGSLKAFKKWVNERIDTAQFQAFPGKHRIQVMLTVQTDGSIRDIHIGNTVPAPIAEEYKRVISQSPLWKPALKDNAPVEAEVVIRFVQEVK